MSLGGDMFSVGDIVEWAKADYDDPTAFYGIVEKVKSSFKVYYFTVRWFDDGTVNDYYSHDLKLIQRV